MKNPYWLLLLSLILLSSCSNEIRDEDSCTSSRELVKYDPLDYVISINTTRDIYNNLGDSLGKDFSFLRTRGSDNPFEEEREVVSNTCVILPELRGDIFLGSVLTRASVANCCYKPIIAAKQPVTVTLSLPESTSGVISNPSYSRYMNYIKEQEQKSSFSQNDEFSYSIEQFTSYNELKSAFGSNINTNALFWSSSTSNITKEHVISKATGLYIKFWQTSFTATMDTPQPPYAAVSSDMLDSAVYVNSISYGRLGILTLETNEKSADAETEIRKCFKTIFTKGTSFLDSDDKTFLAGCDFKVFLLGGSESTAVLSFTGLDGFIEHIKKGVFSPSQPGVPLFCSFANVADNTPANIKFKYNIELYEPLYVELKDRVEGTDHHMSLHFYKNRNKVNKIADPALKFYILKTQEKTLYNGLDDPTTITYDTLYFQNANSDTSLELPYYLGYYHHPPQKPIGKGVWGMIEIKTSEKLLPGPGYEIIGDNPTIVFTPLNN
jgi:thiol-activated cytolysin